MSSTCLRLDHWDLALTLRPYSVTRFAGDTQPVKTLTSFASQIPLGDSLALRALVSSVFTHIWLPNVNIGIHIVFTCTISESKVEVQVLEYLVGSSGL